MRRCFLSWDQWKWNQWRLPEWLWLHVPTLTSMPEASQANGRNQCFPGGVSEPPALNKRILNSLWLSGVSEWHLCPVIARVPTCLLRVRLSQQIHFGEQRENKHTNLETAWESHGNNRQEEKKKLMRRWIFAAGQGGPQENPEKL